MGEQLSLWHLMANATLPVQLVMLLLLLASVASWVIIFQRWCLFRDIGFGGRRFEADFWSGVDLAELYRNTPPQAMGLAAMFRAGFGAFSDLSAGGGADREALLEGVHRAMRVSRVREEDRLDAHLGFLATVGSTAPYIGLFGTVWGIMNAFRGLAGVEQASLAVVAPGIAEALIATAMGLFAAIPAVIAYNRYVVALERLSRDFSAFCDEFAALLHRRLHGVAPSLGAAEPPTDGGEDEDGGEDPCGEVPAQ